RTVRLHSPKFLAIAPLLTAQGAPARCDCREKQRSSAPRRRAASSSWSLCPAYRTPVMWSMLYALKPAVGTLGHRPVPALLGVVHLHPSVGRSLASQWS